MSNEISDNRCCECGMDCSPGEFHPYAACLMFRGCNDAMAVRLNLHALAAERSQPPQHDAMITDGWQLGDVDEGEDMWTAGINVPVSKRESSDGVHDSAIECHARTKEAAELLRAKVMLSVAPLLQSPAVDHARVDVTAMKEAINIIANNLGESLNVGCSQQAVDAINKYVDELFSLAASTTPHERSQASQPDASRERMLVSNGWKLVPIKPTLNMYRAFIMRNKNPRPDDGWNDAYQAMLAAAPSPTNNK